MGNHCPKPWMLLVRIIRHCYEANAKRNIETRNAHHASANINPKVNDIARLADSCVWMPGYPLRLIGKVRVFKYIQSLGFVFQACSKFCGSLLSLFGDLCIDKSYMWPIATQYARPSLVIA